MSGSRRAFEVCLGIATLLPIPIFLTFVALLIASPPADGEFPVAALLLMLLWTMVNFIPAIVLAVDAHQNRSLSDTQRMTWTILLIVFGGFVTPVYYWTRRWPRVTRT
ncbi:MAG TPA: hypothetical protein VI300_10090 [Solirubrobacter sp.]